MNEIVNNVTKWFPALHSLIIGPGLGRDPLVHACIKNIIKAAKEAQIPMVLDGVSEPERILEEIKEIWKRMLWELLQKTQQLFQVIH